MNIPGRSLSKLMDDTSDDWCEYLDSALFAMNTSLQNTTKFTPFYMMFGRNLHFPLEAEKEAESSSIEKLWMILPMLMQMNILHGNIVEKQKTIFPKEVFQIKKRSVQR